MTRLPIFSGTQRGTMACVSYRGNNEKGRVISEAPSSGCRVRRVTPLARWTKKASLVRQIQPLPIPPLFPSSLPPLDYLTPSLPHLYLPFTLPLPSCLPPTTPYTSSLHHESFHHPVHPSVRLLLLFPTLKTKALGSSPAPLAP